MPVRAGKLKWFQTIKSFGLMVGLNDFTSGRWIKKTN